MVVDWLIFLRTFVYGRNFSIYSSLESHKWLDFHEKFRGGVLKNRNKIYFRVYTNLLLLLGVAIQVKYPVNFNPVIGRSAVEKGLLFCFPVFGMLQKVISFPLDFLTKLTTSVV
jgi:hypothetical protein